MKAWIGALMVATLFLMQPAIAQPVVNVKVSEYQYDPPLLTIAVGTTVVWTNVGSIAHEVEPMMDNPAPVGDEHLATVIAPSAPTAPPQWEADIDPGASVSWTFTVPGVYIINCNEGGLHAAMKEVIVVS